MAGNEEIEPEVKKKGKQKEGKKKGKQKVEKLKTDSGSESFQEKSLPPESDVSSSIFYWHSLLLYCGRLLHGVLDFYNQLFDLGQKDKAKIYSNISRHYLNKGLNDKALKYLKEWTQADPANAEAHYQLGLALSASGRKKSALKFFSKVLSIDPGHIGALYRKSSILLKVKDFEGALQELEKAIKITDDNPKFFYLQAIALEGLGQTDKAITSLEQAIELDPNEIKYHQYLGFLNASRDDHKTAAKSFTRVMELEREMDEEDEEYY